MLTVEEAKEKTQAVAIPCYGAPIFMDEDDDFLYYKVTIPKVLLSQCGGGCDSGCGDSCETEGE